MARSRAREELRPRRSAPSGLDERRARDGAACAPSSAMSSLAELHGERLGAEALALARVAGARDEEAAELVVGDAALVGVGIVLVVVGASARRRPAPRGARSRRGTMPSYALRLPSLALVFALAAFASVGRALAPPPKRMRVLAARSGASPTATSGLTPSASTARASSVASATRCRAGPTRGPRLRAACARIADAALGIDDVARAEAVARGARAVRAVEREHARLDGRQRDAAVDAGEALAQPERLLVPRPATSSRPSPSLSASSTLSVRRPLSPPSARGGRRRRRGRAASLRSSSISSPRSTTEPSMRARTKPSRRRRSSSSFSSPLRARAMGASTLSACPRAARGRGRRSAAPSALRCACRSSGSAACRRARRGGAGSRRSR